MNGVVTQIVMHMLTNYQKELGTSPQTDRWPDDLKAKAKLDKRTAEKVLTGQDIGVRTKRSLATWFRGIPGWEKIEHSWFDVGSLEEFLDLHEWSNTRSITKLELEAPRTAATEKTTDGIIGNFVTYRFAFEAVDSEVAREVITFKRDGNKLLFEMSYRITGEDDAAPLHLFRGTAGVIGGSVMAIGTSTASPATDHTQEVDRARSLFFAHSVEPGLINRSLKFGMLSSTRIVGHEPCAACIVMFRVDAEIKDLNHYRGKVTEIRSFDKFVQNDFKGFTPEVHEYLAALLKNAPLKEDNDEEKVLRLHFDRFRHFMKLVWKQSPNIKDLRAPWTAAGVKALMPARTK